MRPIHAAISALVAGAAASVQPAPAADAPKLSPHRVVYDLSLASARGARTIESVRGRIAFELTGNGCEGYALNFRQVTSLRSSETGDKVSDLRTTNFEGGDGRSFRFRNETRAGEGPAQVVDGSAAKGADGLAITLSAPKRDGAHADGPVVFPNAQMQDLVTAAREGRTTLSERVYDGSDDGRKVYDTLAVIGRRAEGETGLEGPARAAGLAGVPRWPVTVSYFVSGRSDGTPVYVLGFDLFDNGVSGSLKLDYGDFALKGEMTRLDMLADKGGSCAR